MGFKLCIGHPWEFAAIAKAMVETGILADFVTVDGSEGGTGAAPPSFADHGALPWVFGFSEIYKLFKGNS